MQQIILDAEAGQILAEFTRCGIAAHALVSVTVALRDDANPPIARDGHAVHWLDGELDLYSDADLIAARR